MTDSAVLLSAGLVETSFHHRINQGQFWRWTSNYLSFPFCLRRQEIEFNDIIINE